MLRQIFEVTNKGGTPGELALRFDLTVPLARFVAKHIDELGVPFKRYAIGSVFRGERPAKGRFREFVQCDFDTIGTESAVADAEIAQVIHAALDAAGVPDFTITLNNRKILDGFLDAQGLTGRSGPVLRALDKLAKIGREAVIDELAKAGDAGGGGLTADQARQVLDFAETGRGGAEVLQRAEAELGSNPTVAQGIGNLRTVLDLLDAAGVPESRVALDLGLARGLDYYTGIVFETTVKGWEKFGSVASGGPIRQPGQPVHAAPAAGRRCLDRPRSAAGAAGRGGLAQVGGDDGAGAGGELSGDRSGRPVHNGRAAAGRGHRRRGLSRPDPDRQADGLRLDARAQAGGDRRARRAGQTGLQPAQPLQSPGGQGARVVGAGRLGRECAADPQAGRGRLMSAAAARSGRHDVEPGRRAAGRPGARHARLAAGRLCAAGRDRAAVARRLCPGGLPADADADPRIHRSARAQERRGDRLQALRAGGRRFGRDLSAARADRQHRAGLCRGAGVPPLPWRVSSSGPVFRYESDPGAGRLREFTQVGVELIGAAGPAADAEVIGLADQIAGEGGRRRRDDPDRPRRA